MPPGVVEVTAPEYLYRVHRGADPLHVGKRKPSTRSAPGSGNRFDSPDGSYGVLYFASTLEACFGETLARLRPAPHLAELVHQDWRQMGVMAPGQIPRDWRERRLASKVDTTNALPFIDIDAAETHQVLRDELALGLSSLGYQDLDISDVRGRDRRLTQMISEWVYQAGLDHGEPRYSGLRYVSRIDNAWECWAVFTPDVELQTVVSDTITPATPELAAVATRFGLTIH